MGKEYGFVQELASANERRCLRKEDGCMLGMYERIAG